MTTTETAKRTARVNTTVSVFDIDPLVYAALASVYGESERDGYKWVEVTSASDRTSVNFFRPAA